MYNPYHNTQKFAQFKVKENISLKDFEKKMNMFEVKSLNHAVR